MHSSTTAKIKKLLSLFIAVEVKRYLQSESLVQYLIRGVNIIKVKH